MPIVSSMSYTELTAFRPECYARFGSALDFKITSSTYSELQKNYRGGGILDVGAGVNRVVQHILSPLPGDYYALDSDPSDEFDFRSFAEIPEGLRFSMVVMNQFLEHLDPDQANAAVSNAFQVLAPGGLLFVSVPNASHPVRYHADVTHVTNWPVGDLYGLLRCAGFEVDNILRANKRRLPRNPFKRWIIDLVCRELRMDWCDTIIMEARKPS